MSQNLKKEEAIPGQAQIEKLMEEKKTEEKVELVKGQGLSVDGYVYLVERAAPPFFTLKFREVDQQEKRPKEHRRRLKKGDCFIVSNCKYRIMSNVGNFWFRAKKIKDLPK